MNTKMHWISLQMTSYSYMIKKAKQTCDLYKRDDSKPALAITKKTRRNCEIRALHGEYAGNGV